MKKILVIILLLILTGCSTVNKDEPDYYFTALELSDALYNSDDISYKNKRIQITAVYLSIDSSDETTIMQLSNTFTCEFNDEIEEILSLIKYSKIVVNGTIESDGSETFRLKNCELIEVVTEPDLVFNALDEHTVLEEILNSVSIRTYNGNIFSVNGVISNIEWENCSYMGCFIELDSTFKIMEQDTRIYFTDEIDISEFKIGDTVVVEGTILDLMGQDKLADGYLTPGHFILYGYSVILSN